MHKKDRPMLSVTALLYGTTSPNNQILFQNNNGNNGMNPSSVSPTELSISPVPPLSVGSASGTLSPTNGSNPTFQSQTSTSSSICDNGGARTPGTPSQQYPPNHPLSGSKHLCAICEDRASGKHYGVYSCEGCKGFFKRTVRKDLTYVCRDEKHCIVDKRQRNRCQYCRYQKCLDMGMKREAVQEERQRNKPENEVESSTNSITPTFMSSSQSILNNSSSILNQSTNNNNNNNVSSLPLLHRADSVSSMLGNSNNNGSNGNNRNGNGNNNLGSISNDSQFLDLNIDRINEAQRAIEVRLNETIPNTKIASCEIKLLFRWIRYIPYFNQLTFEDQVTLLKTGWNELLISEFSYRSIGKTDALVLANGVVVSRANANLAGVGNIMDRVLNELVAKFRAMEMDRSELGCLRAIVLLNPVPLAIKNLNNSSMVERLRDRIYSILENHCRNRYPDQSSRFAKLLVRLPALRSIGLRCVEQLFFQNLLQETNRKESIESFISNKLNSNYD